jgi:hypothetical protein
MMKTATIVTMRISGMQFINGYLEAGNAIDGTEPRGSGLLHELTI